ncbi:hypothetical protein CBG55_10080 [Prevotella intermedia]|uniref:Uncharacterized protein n=1 Tax=Prevotella intermedia TaxID=28131 RepID=A0A2M8TJS4_PREIN|nr:hypothetical protein [Prevotella intermedia]OWP31567.1 hypothetical protein CBG55_10080 [Prevotella intermedia]PJI24177.1 hypothetical protein CTM59_08525 [Prevotella intermedia]
MLAKNIYSIIDLFPPKNKMRKTEFVPFNCETAGRLQMGNHEAESRQKSGTNGTMLKLFRNFAAKISIH